MHPCLKTMIAVGDIPVMSVSGELRPGLYLTLYLPPPRPASCVGPAACPGGPWHAAIAAGLFGMRVSVRFGRVRSDLNLVRCRTGNRYRHRYRTTGAGTGVQPDPARLNYGVRFSRTMV